MYQDFHKQYPYLCEINGFNESTVIREEEIEARKLIHPCRLDFMAKLLYLDGMEDEIENPGKDIYEKHLIAFSDGRMIEKGQEGKKGLQKYMDTFRSLWESVSKYEGEILDIWPSVPVDSGYLAVDGAHRVSCAIKAQKKIRVYYIHFEAPEYCRYNFLYCRKKYLDEHYILEMVKKYCSIRQTSLIVSSEADNKIWEKIYHSYTPVYMNRVKGQTIAVFDTEISQMKDFEKETLKKETILTEINEIIDFLSVYQKKQKDTRIISLKKKVGRRYHRIRSYLWDIKDKIKKKCIRG